MTGASRAPTRQGAIPSRAIRRSWTRSSTHVTAHGGGAVLDIGFGTGTLTARLYAQGCRIYGQDFSERMVQLAQEKMPDAKLYSGDFKQGLVEPLRAQRYDFILATYSLHHLTDAEKVPFLNGAAGAAEGGRRDPDR